MFTTSRTANALMRLWLGAPREFIDSADGRALLARGMRLVRKQDGREAARVMRNSLIVADSWPNVDWMDGFVK